MATHEQFTAGLDKLRNSNTLILTIGNILKGDDAIGPLLYQQLKGKLCVEIIDAGTVPENYIQPIIKKAPENLLIIDAVDFAAQAGTIRLFESSQLSSLIISTHSLSPRIFVDMIMQEIDVHAYFLGVQPAQTSIGQSLSPEVAGALERLTETLVRIFPIPTEN